jgi:predicted cupin superfamily sugar epimerase
VIDLRDPALPAEAVAAALGLQPHPEGGQYRETWRDPGRDSSNEGRGAGTAILFLLAAGEVSHWHRVDAAELWVWQGGSPLRLDVSADGGAPDSRTLGPLFPDHTPHHLVAAECWQSARSLGPWSLVTCVVAPAFSFDGFVLAPPEWQPG